MRTLIAPVVAFFALAGAAIGATAQTAPASVQGSAEAGAKKSAMCMGCHGIPGYQASFPEVYKVPMIAGQNAKYLEAALTEYKAGDRKHPTMRAIAASLSTQDMADLATYFSKLPGQPAALPDTPQTQPSAQVAELLKKGNCVSCHGSNFSKPIDTGYPKLAGQHPSYIYAALKAYQTHDNPNVGRANPVMGGMAAPFSHDQLEQIAQYIGSLDGQLRVVPESRFK